MPRQKPMWNIREMDGKEDHFSCLLFCRFFCVSSSSPSCVSHVLFVLLRLVVSLRPMHVSPRSSSFLSLPSVSCPCLAACLLHCCLSRAAVSFSVFLSLCFMPGSLCILFSVVSCLLIPCSLLSRVSLSPSLSLFLCP